MKTILVVPAAILTALLMLPEKGNAQTPPKTPTIAIAGQHGEAPLLQLNGKLYVEVQTLARLTKGTLAFKGHQTILSLPPTESIAPESASRGKSGFSVVFVQASIEELSLIREWRIAIVRAVENNTPAEENWIAEHQRLAEKNLALASAAATTDDDRSASPLLASEFNNMKNLSERYLALRKQYAFISPGTFGSGSLEQQILRCAQDFVSMTESRTFQDQAACH